MQLLFSSSKGRLHLEKTGDAAISTGQDSLAGAGDKAMQMATENLEILDQNAKIIVQKFRQDVEESYKNPLPAIGCKIAGGQIGRESTFTGVGTSTIKEGVVSPICGLFDVVESKDNTECSQFKKSVANMIGAVRGGLNWIADWIDHLGKSQSQSQFTFLVSINLSNPAKYAKVFNGLYNNLMTY